MKRTMLILLSLVALAASVEAQKKNTYSYPPNSPIIAFDVPTSWSVTPDPEEIADVRWLTPDAIAEEIRETPDAFSPAFRLLFAAFRDGSGVSSE